MFSPFPRIALTAFLTLTSLSSIEAAPSGQLILQDQPQLLPMHEGLSMSDDFKAKRLNINSTVKMNNGIEIPILGFGVYQSPPDVTNRSVTTALEAGYRHIDSAQVYRNEAQSGLAIHNSPLPRSSIFLTTKLRWSVPRAEIYDSLRESVKKIGLGYVDLFLIHAPLAGPGREGREGQWRELEGLVEEGLTRSIGVSN